MNHLIFKQNALLGQIRNPSSLIVQGKAGHRKVLPFTKDEVVQGRVIRPISPNRALLLFGEERVTARTSVPLRAGQIAFFKVEQVSPQCVLRLVEPPIGDLTSSPPLNNLDALKEQDLKGLALKTLSDGVVNKFVSAEAISKFVDSLEQFQLLNVSRLEGEGKLFFTIPLQFHDKLSFGEILIDVAGKREDESPDRDGDKVLRVSFLLHMSCLGPVRADVSVFQKTIRVGFWVSREEIQSLFNNYKALLKNQLERHGFGLQEVTCCLQEASVLTQTSLVEELLDSEEHQINVIV